MRTFRLAVSLFASIFAASAIASASPLTQAQMQHIDAIAAHALKAQHISGMEIAVGRNGNVLYTRGYGLRNRAHGLPVTAQTVFPIGSVTKQFTAAAVMELVDRGKINLNAHVSAYIPNAPHGSEITIRELLNQTSGLPDYLEDKPLLASIMSGTVGPSSVPRLVALVDGKPLHFKPGTKYEYSNTNYALAGMIVAKVSGMPYGDFLRSTILQREHLSSMQYMRYSPPSGSNAARGYNYAKGQFTVIPRFSMDWGNAAGALASDAGDIVRWDNDFFSGQVVPLREVRIATTPPARIVMLASKNRVNNIGLGYAFGWVQARAEGRPMVWHNGGLPGARAMNATFPADGLEIVVLTNATDAEPETVALQIARYLYDNR